MPPPLPLEGSATLNRTLSVWVGDRDRDRGLPGWVPDYKATAFNSGGLPLGAGSGRRPAGRSSREAPCSRVPAYLFTQYASRAPPGWEAADSASVWLTTGSPWGLSPMVHT